MKPSERCIEPNVFVRGELIRSATINVTALGGVLDELGARVAALESKDQPIGAEPSSDPTDPEDEKPCRECESRCELRKEQYARLETALQGTMTRAAELWLEGAEDGDYLPLRDYAEQLEHRIAMLESKRTEAIVTIRDLLDGNWQLARVELPRVAAERDAARRERDEVRQAWPAPEDGPPIVGNHLCLDTTAYGPVYRLRYYDGENWRDRPDGAIMLICPEDRKRWRLELPGRINYD